LTGILDKFCVENGNLGPKIITRSRQLTSGCVSDSEIESSVEMLKDDLDACAREMKRLLNLNRGSLFDGWPSANDE
jgi:hypothetical protein